MSLVMGQQVLVLGQQVLVAEVCRYYWVRLVLPWSGIGKEDMRYFG